MQLVHIDAAMALYLPAMHCVHVKLPVDDLNLPATHALHELPFNPE
jgi:hypothetical protein